VRKQKQIRMVHFAPPAAIPVSQFDEVDRAVVLGRPTTGQDFSHAGIDLHEGPGTQDGKERVVFQSDIPVQVLANVEILDERDGNLSPDFDHAGKQVSASVLSCVTVG